jgi:membrane protein YqaA with SNARE-associated domain
MLQLAGLFALAFLEAAFLPVSPALLFIPLALANPGSSVLYGIVGFSGAVLGSLLGYFIGHRLGYPLLRKLAKKHSYMVYLESEIRRYGVWPLAVSGILPLPYEIFTLGYGALRTPLGRFILAAAVSRLIHYGVQVALVIGFGPKILDKLQQYHLTLPWILAFLLLLIVGYQFWRRYKRD